MRDVGTLNGTYVNRERIDVAPLASGDEVQIGKFRLVFLTGRGRRAGRALTAGPGRSGAGRGQRRGARAAHDHRRGARRCCASEFPDVTISKIRFLEAEGLVEPQRTPSGYRKFSRGDVDRLRFVLAAQRDHYLPLRVIKDHLEALDRGLEPPRRSPVRRVPRSPARPTAAGADAFAADADRVRLSRAELLGTPAWTPRSCSPSCEQFGLVVAAPGPATTTATRWSSPRPSAELARLGIEPRHLRLFRPAPTARSGWSSRSSRPLLRSAPEDARARAADEVVRELAALSVAAARHPGRQPPARPLGR